MKTNPFLYARGIELWKLVYSLLKVGLQKTDVEKKVYE